MAIINQNELFDRLRQYIDEKITNLPDSIAQVLEYYGYKEVSDNMDSVLIVAENIDQVKLVAGVSDEILAISDPLVLAAIVDAEANAIISHKASMTSQAEAMTSESYATEAFNVFVVEYLYDDATDTIISYTTSEFSAWHWSEVSRLSAEGLKWQGSWDLSGMSPTDLPPTPETFIDPDTDLPMVLETGMFWYVIGADSVYDPLATGTPQPYPIYGPNNGSFKIDDRLVYAPEDTGHPDYPRNPYDPWLRLLDFVQWERVISVPDNIINAADRRGRTAGDSFSGDIVIEKSSPALFLSDVAANDKNARLMVDADKISIATIDDLGAYLDTKLHIEFDAKMLQLTDTLMMFGDDTVWTSGNDGAGTELDAGMLEGKRANEFAQSGKTPIVGSISNITEPGIYLTGLDTSNLPDATNSDGSLTVGGNGSTIRTYTWVMAGESNTVWNRTYKNSIWSEWLQLGHMTFDGTYLRITL